MRAIFCLLVILIAIVTCCSAQMSTIAQWKKLEFDFPSEGHRQTAIRTKQYIPGNGIPLDVAVYYNQGVSGMKVFVTIPRVVDGVPITFGTLTDRTISGERLIRAYPEYSWHENQGKNCEGITSVYRVAIDECGRLWVLDTGRLGDVQSCDPQILIFNLSNDKLIRRFIFPANDFICTTLFITPIVDVRDPQGTCSDTMVYIADNAGFSLIVYSYKEDKSWRILNKWFYPDPSYGTFTIDGDSFELMDGIFGMATSPKTSENRFLYFHAATSSREIFVPLALLDNSTIWENNSNAEPQSFKELGNRNGQSTIETMDSNGNLFFGLIDPIGIGCWHTSSQTYDNRSIKIIAQDNQRLQFISGMKIVKNLRQEEELWALSCRYQKFATGTISTNEINFRILAGKVDQLIQGNKCL